MAAPTPYILVHCNSALVVTRVGLVPEVSGQPILCNGCTARATLSTDKLEDFYGDLFAQAWGNRKLVFDLSMDQMAQYGVSDSYLGRFDTTLLANLAPNFGMDAANSGTALMTQGSRELVPGRLPKVNLTIEVEDTRHAGLGSPDGASTPSWGSTPAGTKPAITSSATAAGTIGTAFSYTITATGTATITFSLAPGVTLPAGLALVGAVISGTPTGAASFTDVELRASNDYGTAALILHLTIAEAAATPAVAVQAYVRYLVDSGEETVVDGFWARSYAGISPEPEDMAEFFAGTPSTNESTLSDPGTPDNPNSLTGGIGVGSFAITAAEATNLISLTAHGFTAGTKVIFPTLTGGAGLTAGHALYYVIASGLAADEFKVSATDGGSEVDITTDVTAGTVSPVSRIWQITEIYGLDPITEEYEYWYQRDSDVDTVLEEAVDRGVDILGDATTPYILGEDIGEAGPGDPAAPSWPGDIEPSEQIQQYFLYKNYDTDETVCIGLGGNKTCADLNALRASYPYLHLNYTETKTTVLLEFYDNTGTPGYIYQRDTSEDTRIADALTATKSPVFHAGSVAGQAKTSTPNPVPDYTVSTGLPTPPATSTGPAPDPQTWLYVLDQFWVGGEIRCWGLRAHVPTVTDFSLSRLLELYGKTAALDAHTETTAGIDWVKEVWATFDAGVTWKCYYLDPNYTSIADSLIGLSLADDVSPVNNPLVAPGAVYSDAVTEW